jgi:TRAP-type C4-dicarboxylate transport system substrate-binding protein
MIYFISVQKKRLMIPILSHDTMVKKRRRLRMKKTGYWYFGILAITLLIFGALPAPARALDVILINDVPDGHPRLKYALQIEADVAKTSGGAIRVVTNRSFQGKAGLDAFLADKAQIATLNSAHLESVDPRIGFVNLPFGMSDAAMERPGALDRTIALMQKQLDAKGLVILGVMRGADNLFVFKNRKVLKPSDLVGVRLRVTGEGIYEQIMRSLGADPVPMAIGQIKAAIAEGKVEGFTARHVGAYRQSSARLDDAHLYLCREEELARQSERRTAQDPGKGRAR